MIVALNHDILHGQEVFRGILSYARPERPWMLRTVPPQDVGDAVGAGVIDGVIGILWQDHVVTPLIRRGVPAVNVSGFRAQTRTPAVTVDNEHVDTHGMTEGEDGHFYWVSLAGTASIAYQLRIAP